MSVGIDTLRIKDKGVLNNIGIVKEMIKNKINSNITIYPVPPLGDRGQVGLN